jgi:hypothetical protein
MSLAAAGDVDGDGWGDVLVAYVRGSESKTEFVQVVSGRTGGVLRTHALAPVPDPQPIEASMYDPWLERQAFVSTAPDMDGDGFAEHLLCWSNHWDAVLRRSGRIEVRSGRSGTLLHELAGDESTYWGSAPLTIDLDRDGLPELCTNGAHPAAPIGRVELHSLASGRRLVALEGSGTEGFGLSAALIGDVDGDTAPDLLVGSYKLSARGWASGGCLLYSVWDPEREEPRSPPVLIRRYPAAAHQERFGSVVLPLGDVDGDGTPDFCASGWYASAGSFHNGIVRAVSGADGRELWLARGDTPLADFGRSAAVLDDVDGDGTPEVVVGARRSSAGGREFCGSFSVLSGATGRTLLKIDGAGIWDGLGSSVASAGDVNGDGRADVLVSEHFPGDGQDVGNRPEREILERVYVYSVVPLR